MKRSKALVLAMAVLALTGACFRHTYTAGAGAPPDGELVYDHWHHHWVFGLISPEQNVNLAKLCPSGNATVEQEMTFLNGLVNALIGFIYSPRTVQVRCGEGVEAVVAIDEEQALRIVHDPRFLDWVRDAAPTRFDEAQLALIGESSRRDEVAAAPRAVTEGVGIVGR